MKRLLPVILLVAVLCCTLTGCFGEKTNMAMMANAIQDGTLDADTLDIYKEDGVKDPGDDAYITNGSCDYTQTEVYYYGSRIPSLSQSVKEYIIECLTDGANPVYESKGEYYKGESSSLTRALYVNWYMDKGGDYGECLKGEFTYTKNFKKNGSTDNDATHISFKFEFKINNLDPFYSDVNKTDAFYTKEDLANGGIEITEYSNFYDSSVSTEGDAGILNEHHLELFLEYLNDDLHLFVKTCEKAGYPIVIPE